MSIVAKWAGITIWEVSSMSSVKPHLDPFILSASGFREVGIWGLQDDGALMPLQKVPAGPGVYAFVIGNRVVYVGVAIGGLRRRLRCYARPGKRKTARRIRDEILKAVDRPVRAMCVQPSDTQWNGLPVNIAAGLELGLIQTYDLPWNRRHASMSVKAATVSEKAGSP